MKLLSLMRNRLSREIFDPERNLSPLSWKSDEMERLSAFLRFEALPMSQIVATAVPLSQGVSPFLFINWHRLFEPWASLCFVGSIVRRLLSSEVRRPLSSEVRRPLSSEVRRPLSSQWLTKPSVFSFAGLGGRTGGGGL